MTLYPASSAQVIEFFRDSKDPNAAVPNPTIGPQK